MKILLIDPPYDRLIGFKSEWFPLGLLSIASFLSKKNMDVKVYNAEHSPSSEESYMSIVEYSKNIDNYNLACLSKNHPVWIEVRNRIKEINPDVIGISVLSPKVLSAFKVASIAKECNTEVKIVCGNHHPTTMPEEILADENIDFVIRGEGEITFYELLKKLQTERPVFETIKGLSFKQNGQFIHNEKRELIKNLDDLPQVDRSLLLDIDTYSCDQLSMMMTSRGCPYNCGFCASKTIWDRKVRYRSIDRVIDEINDLKKNFGIQNITLMDDAFTINKKRVEDFCKALLDKRVKIAWSCLTRVDIISHDLLKLMKKAGCTKIIIGVESGSERILKLTNKNLTLEEIRSAVKVIRECKMYWAGFFLFGVPTESEEEIYATLNFMKELKPDWAYISIFTPYPETKLYDMCKQNGLIKNKVEYEKYTHQTAALDFSGSFSKKRGKELATFLFKEFHAHNSSYKSLFKRALTRNYHKKPALFLHDLKKVLSWIKKRASK